MQGENLLLHPATYLQGSQTSFGKVWHTHTPKRIYIYIYIICICINMYMSSFPRTWLKSSMRLFALAFMTSTCSLIINACDSSIRSNLSHRAWNSSKKRSERDGNRERGSTEHKESRRHPPVLTVDARYCIPSPSLPRSPWSSPSPKSNSIAHLHSHHVHAGADHRPADTEDNNHLTQEPSS